MSKDLELPTTPGDSLVLRTRNYWETIRVPKDPSGTSRTKQSFKDDCDINAIVRRWQATGVLEHVLNIEPRYGDFSNATDYLDAKQRVINAERNFEALPSSLREASGNDPAKFIEWIHDPENRQELEAEGLGELAKHLHGATEPIPETPSDAPQSPTGDDPAKTEPTAPAPPSKAAEGE